MKIEIIFRDMVPETMRCTLVTNAENEEKEEDIFLWILILEEDLEVRCPVW